MRPPPPSSPAVFRSIVLAFPLARLFCQERRKSATDRRIDRLCTEYEIPLNAAFDVRRLIMPSHSKKLGMQYRMVDARSEKEREIETVGEEEGEHLGGNSVTRKGMCHRELAEPLQFCSCNEVFSRGKRPRANEIL